jgi:hypothetical protein
MRSVVEQPRDAKDNVLTSPVGSAPKTPSHTGHGTPEKAETGTKPFGEGVQPKIPTNTGHTQDIEQEIIQTMFESRGDGLIPGTSEHKAARWKEYQESGRTLDYENWIKRYEIAMQQARKANAAADSYHKEIGWGKREVTVDLSDNARRRLDIADFETQRGIEYKTGEIYRSQEIRSEIERDAILVKKGWDIEWVFEGTASKPLLNDLEKAGIRYKFRNTKPNSTNE